MLRDFIEKDPSGNTSLLIIFITIFFFIVIIAAYFFDYLRNNQNQLKMGILERAIKDLIEEFRSLELNLSEQKN